MTKSLLSSLGFPSNNFLFAGSGGQRRALTRRPRSGSSPSQCQATSRRWIPDFSALHAFQRGELQHAGRNSSSTDGTPLPEGYSMYDPKVIKGGSIESWTLAPDGKSVTLNVRKGIKFNHTGNPVTADDFIYYYDRGIKTKSGYLWNIKNANIERWEKTGLYQLKVFFSKPSPFFFYLFRDQLSGAR